MIAFLIGTGRAILLLAVIAGAGVTLSACGKQESAHEEGDGHDHEHEGHDHEHGEEGHKHVDGDEKK